MRAPLLFSFSIVIVTLAACAPARRAEVAATSHTPSFVLNHGSDDEARTREQVESLLARYDLDPWMFAPAIAIDRDDTPHSHPVLTLHTRHLHDDLLLLSTLIHEESHWFLEQHPEGTAAAVEDLKKMFPGLPVGYPDGARDERSSYEHLLVILCEQRGLKDLVGELAARQAMEFWATDHYRVLYRRVLDDGPKIRDVMHAHGLNEPRPLHL